MLSTRKRPHQLEAFGVPRLQVTTLFVDALVFQVWWEAGKTMQNIGEMVVLCRELVMWTWHVSIIPSFPWLGSLLPTLRFSSFPHILYLC